MASQHEPVSDMFSSLSAVIHDNGRRVEENEGAYRSSAGNMVYYEDNGFQIWIGSLEDALSLRSLSDQGINAFLNVALDECIRDCAGFAGGGSCGGTRPRMGRQRTHARGTSIGTSVSCGGDLISLHPTDLRALVTFDDTWYGTALSTDVEYMGVEAEDAEGYCIQEHFPDTTDFLMRCRDEGRKVFVHCMMGVNRSVACTVAFMCAGLGMPLREAVHLVSMRRGFVLSNASFLKQLIDNFCGPLGGALDSIIPIDNGSGLIVGHADGDSSIAATDTSADPQVLQLDS